jgi:hypothetical protein
MRCLPAMLKETNIPFYRRFGFTVKGKIFLGTIHRRFGQCGEIPGHSAIPSCTYLSFYIINLFLPEDYY